MYQVPDQSIWKGRINPEPGDLLFHQVISMLDMTADIWMPETNDNIALIGFCSDEGVRRNFGRIGSKNGPFEIRKALSKMVPHYDHQNRKLVDSGNVLCSGQNLESAFQLLQTKIEKLLTHGYFPIVMGGGHETSYPSISTISRHFAEGQLGIINFDAHFDMRSYENGPHSGSSFRQLMDDFAQVSKPFHYLPIGIQHEVNTPSLFEVMHQNQQSYILLDEVRHEFSDVLEKIKDFAGRMDSIYITIDMDCFPAGYAPGVSAVAPDGLVPTEVKFLIKVLQKTQKVVALDIVELNPEFDRDNVTAKLAADLVACFLNHY